MSLLAAAALSGATPPVEEPGTPLDPPVIPSTAPYNTDPPLITPTYEGSGETVHLDVIDLGPGGWKGLNKRFVMVHTPYPNYNADWEDPSLLISDDGVNWTTPAGLTNPLYRPTQGAYNNDPDMVYDPDADELILWWRDYDVLARAHSSDGITWPASGTIGGRISVSPCFLRDPSGTWHMWTVGGHSIGPGPTGPWTYHANTGLTGVWHFNVANAPGGGFHMLFHDDTSGQRNIKTASSANGHAWTINPNPVLVSGTHPWSQSNLYRPALALHEDGDRYRVWYSGVGPNPANTNRAAWRVGYTEIPLTEWPPIP